MDKPIRINKYLSQAGHCSRREADALILQGRVSINQQIPEMGQKVNPGDRVYVDNKPILLKETPKVYLAFNKPKGVVCTTNSKVEKNNIVDYINYPERIYPVGRLDKMSEGLILMTNDGDIVNNILRARNHHEKEYIVKVARPVSDEFITNLGNGVSILDTKTRPCKVEKIDTYTFKIILTQGLNRQIRRMCEALDYRVTKLKRTRIKHIPLDVEVGKYRYLTPTEINGLQS